MGGSLIHHKYLFEAGVWGDQRRTSTGKYLLSSATHSIRWSPSGNWVIDGQRTSHRAPSHLSWRCPHRHPKPGSGLRQPTRWADGVMAGTPSITITAPAAGHVYELGATYRITFTALGSFDTVVVGSPQSNGSFLPLRRDAAPPCLAQPALDRHLKWSGWLAQAQLQDRAGTFRGRWLPLGQTSVVGADKGPVQCVLTIKVRPPSTHCYRAAVAGTARA